MNKKKILLIGCGILKKEIKWLIEKNNWPLETLFLDTALDVNFKKLEKTLKGALLKHRKRDVIVFYGTCHPLMDEILANANVFRTEGQNCADMLLGHELFTAELSKGAFFMLEDWANQWDRIMLDTYGKHLNVARDIYHDGHSYLLCLKTPCSEDFTTEVEKAGKMVDLPLLWMDVALDHLETVLWDAISKKMRCISNG